MKYEFYSVTYSWALRPSKDDENYQEYIDLHRRCTKLRRRLGTMCAVDRSGKYQFSCPTVYGDYMPLQEFSYKKVDSLKDLMYKRSEELIKRNELIQFFWSGGVDSTAALLILNDVCPIDQFFVQLTPSSIKENPVVWEGLVKKLNYKIYEGDHLLSVADTKNIVVECGSADILHNSFRGNEGPDGLKAGGDPKRRWYMKRRFLVNDRKYRFFLHTPEDILNLNNIEPFYETLDIEQFFMNKILDGSLKNTNRNDDVYLTCKVDLRNIIREYYKEVGDTLLGIMSIRGNEKSIDDARRLGRKFANWSTLAITVTGKVIRKKDINV